MVEKLFVILPLIFSCLYVFYFVTYYLQLNRYEIMTTCKAIMRDFWWRCFVLLLLNCSVFIVYFILSEILVISLSAFVLFVQLFLFFHDLRKFQKKNRLKFTNRVIRFLLVDILLSLICVFLFLVYGYGFFFIVLGVHIPYALSFCISSGIEYLISLMYIYATKKKLNKYKNIQVIGITGSYGKTSTKNILYNILKEDYIVLATPKSYNTPMGITKFILGADLNFVDFLIIEMGAVRKGDIRKLCRLVDPDIGILTSIGEQHLQTFKTIDNIVKTKSELSEYIYYKQGKMFYNLNNTFCFDLFFNDLSCLKYGICVYSSNEIDKMYKTIVNKYVDNVLYLNILKTSKHGADYLINDNCTKTVGYLSTKLLGVSNAINIALAVAVSLCLGVCLDSIAKSILQLEYIPNRMDLRVAASGANVIYDAYNSNKDSFEEMLQTVKNFNASYKLLITPGVVELGKKQYLVNKQLAYKSTKIFNEIWIINKVNKYAFLEGVKESGSDIKVQCYDELSLNIFDEVNKLDERFLVVFENDLPDIYK